MHKKFFDIDLKKVISEPRHSKAIDVIKLLEDINEIQPETIADVNKIILRQKQYDMMTFDE